jgi:excisionase family DNA binding protein
MVATNNPKGRPAGIVERRPRRRRKQLDADRLYYSPAEVAKVTGIGVGRVRRSLKALGAKRLGGRVLIPVENVKPWVASLPDAA